MWRLFVALETNEITQQSHNAGSQHFNFNILETTGTTVVRTSIFYYDDEWWALPIANCHT